MSARVRPSSPALESTPSRGPGPLLGGMGNGAMQERLFGGSGMSAVNDALSSAFGLDVSGRNLRFGDNGFNAGIGAAGHTAPDGSISLGAGIRPDLSDPFSMEVIAHEMSHALGGVGSGESLIDQPGDPGEDKALRAGREFGSWVRAGGKGAPPRLKPATGGKAAIHRYALDGVLSLVDPVHEDITREAMRRAGMGDAKGKWTEENTELLRGVYWNDDPTGKMFRDKGDNSEFGHRGSYEWLKEFKETGDEAEENVENGGHGYEGKSLTGRSHHGDLQFLHGMATKDGEKASETKGKMLEYSRFTTLVATGAIDGKKKLSDLSEDELPPGMAALLKDQKDMTVEEFYGIKDGNGNVADRAMGSLLHMVQDSHAEGHAERDPVTGEILQFHSYTGQSHAKHAHADELQEDANGNKVMPPGSEEATKACMDLLKRRADMQAKGMTPKQIADELQKDMDTKHLRLADPDKEAEAGHDFEKHDDEEKSTMAKLKEWACDHPEIVNPIADELDKRADENRALKNAYKSGKEWLGDRWDDAVDGYGRGKKWAGDRVDDAKELYEDGKDWAGDRVDDAKELYEDGKEWAGDRVDDAKEVYDDGKEWAGDRVDDAKEAWSGATDYLFD